jgi:hypothetical protein
VVSMRSLGSFILLAGIGVALFVYLPAPVDSGPAFEHGQRISRVAQLPQTPIKAVARLSAFSPSIALTIPVRRGTRVALLDPAQAPTPVAIDAPFGWQTVVAATPTSTPPLPTTLVPRDPDARYKLVVDIQQQLRRVGCYWGGVDGSWGIATKDALKEFTDRVNATLPLDQPDYVQLALIQSHAETTCGACPAGQSLPASGRCAAPQFPTAQKEVLPWKVAPGAGAAVGQPLFKPVPILVVSTEPLPGQMAIGGPIPTTADVQQSVPPVTPGAAAAPSGLAIAALDPNVAAVKSPVFTVAPGAKRVSRSGDRRRVHPDHHRRFAGDYRRTGSGTPRYNVLLSLGGLY